MKIIESNWMKFLLIANSLVLLMHVGAELITHLAVSYTHLTLPTNREV